MLFVLLNPILVDGQPTEIIKSDSLNLCILKLDFLTYKFEGGNISYYKKCKYSDTLPFKIDYKSPGDFGGITFKIKETSDTFFDATIIWMGRGIIKYPKTFRLNAPFNLIKQIVPKPVNIEYFDWIGQKVKNDILFIKQADSAWEAIKSLNITNEFAKAGFKVGIYLYTPSVGAVDPTVAKWIIFLYHNNTSNSINKLSSNDKFEMYPNPCTGLIHFNTKEQFNFKIFDSNGRLVSVGKLKNNQIDLKDLADGVYFFTFYNSKITLFKKIIKINNR